MVIMPGMKCTPDIDRASDAIGFTNDGLIRQYGDLTEPEHKMYCLTADIIYKITSPIKG